MSIKDKLQITIITYNRAKHLKKTLEQLFAETSAVKDFDILILDNNSSDNTLNIVEDLRKNHSNLKYKKNNHNLGLSGNIAMAMELVEKEYLWILGDDDLYDFSNWSEVEQAIENKESAICIARYIIPDENKNDIAYQLLQTTFISGLIFKTSLLTDTTMRNVFDNIYTLFPHIAPLIKLINDDGHFYVVNKAISNNGFEETTDCSYTRGNEKDELFPKTKKMTWLLGYANILSGIHNKKLACHCFEVAAEIMSFGWKNFYRNTRNAYAKNKNYLEDMYEVMGIKRRFLLKHFLYSPIVAVHECIRRPREFFNKFGLLKK